MLDNFKYIKNVSEGVGTMHLYGQIGDSVDPNGKYIFGISGSSFAYEMMYLSGICDTINVRINSVGGSVLDGYSIISSILSCSKPVNTYIDGLAASISGVIAMSGVKCYMMDYGTLMLHNPSGTNDQKVLDLVKETLVTILSNRCNKTPEQISAMMEKETWLNAEDAIKHGMVNEIVSSGKKVKIEKTDSLYNMAIIYNKLINKTMNKTNQLLGLKNEAEESDQVLAIEVLKNSLSEMEAENAKLKSQVEAYNAEKEAKELAEKEALKNKATLMANNAHKEGKLKESEVESTIVNASKDEASFEFVSNMVNRLGNIKEAVKVFNPKNVADVEDKSTWTLKEWETKDPEGLKVLYVENKEKFNELAKNYTK